MNSNEVYGEFARMLGNDPWPGLRRARTARVLKALDDTAQRIKADVRIQYRANPRGRKFGEWVLDFCAMDQVTQDILLASESSLSERALDDVMDDFAKLFHIRAQTRLFVFECDANEVLEGSKAASSLSAASFRR